MSCKYPWQLLVKVAYFNMDHFLQCVLIIEVSSLQSVHISRSDCTMYFNIIPIKCIVHMTYLSLLLSRVSLCHSTRVICMYMYITIPVHINYTSILWAIDMELPKIRLIILKFDFYLRDQL